MSDTFEAIWDTCMKQSEVTAAALIDRAQQDFGGIVAAYDIPAELKDRFAAAGAQQALMEAYVTLSGQELASLSPEEMEATISQRVAMLASGIRTFAREASNPPGEARHG